MTRQVRRVGRVIGDLTRVGACTRHALRGWWWVLPLAWVAAPSRLSSSGISRLRGRQILLSLRCGARVFCRLDEVFTVVEVFGLGEYEGAALQSGSRAPVIVDVGANIGVATVWLAWRFPEATIVAIEPDGDAILRLRKNIAINGLTQRVQSIHGGVGARDGTAALHHGRTSSVNTLEPSTGRDDEELVQVLSLGSVISLAGGYIGVLKIDCEGAEYEFLSGDVSPGPAVIGMIVGEYHRGGSREHRALVALLRLHGYEVETKRTSGLCGTFCARV